MARPSRFDAGFRAQAVDLVRGSKRSRSAIAADLGVSDTTLANWMKDKAKKQSDDAELSESERAELQRLRDEKRFWLIERDILKKGHAFWVRESNG